MSEKISDYSAFIKLRLSLLVVFSAGIGYLFAAKGPVDWVRFSCLIFAGFLVTGASNGFNQVFEKEHDKLMNRTSNRPLPAERMSRKQGFLLSIIMGVCGLFILAVFINFLSFLLGLFALTSYAFIYTPLKRKTPFAVFVGAFPGAIPPMLGYVAAAGVIDLKALLLFAIQFIWQFPHFWAIAWVLHEDYQRAGFKMLPSGERDKQSAFQALVYSAGLIPISLLPYLFKTVNGWSSFFILVCGIVFLLQSLNLYRKCDSKAASRLMFGSFFYLPLVQLLLLFGKI